MGSVNYTRSVEKSAEFGSVMLSLSFVRRVIKSGERHVSSVLYPLRSCSLVSWGGKEKKIIGLLEDRFLSCGLEGKLDR